MVKGFNVSGFGRISVFVDLNLIFKGEEITDTISPTKNIK
jgi:hypothetical protein